MHGKGVFKFASGKIYTGEFVEDRREGFGTMTWPDGRAYEGIWTNGIMNGYGKMVYPDGTIKDGLWVNGKEPVKKTPKAPPTLALNLIPLDIDAANNQDNQENPENQDGN